MTTPTAPPEPRAFPPIAAKTTITSIVPAAGRGARTGLSENKILAPLGEKPLLWWTLRALTHPNSLPENCECREVLVVARREEWDEIEARVLAPLRRELADSSKDSGREYSQPKLRLVEGGASRQSSVLSGAFKASGELLLVHDAARPLLSPTLCAKVIEAALESGAAIAAEAARDTVKIAREPRSDTSQNAGSHAENAPRDSRVLATPLIERTIERSTVFLAQTPQVFLRAVLLEALQKAQREGFEGTDCASLVERLENAPPVELVCDGSFNLKVTRREDFAIAEAFLRDFA